MILNIDQLNKSNCLYFNHELILWIPPLHTGTIVVHDQKMQENSNVIFGSSLFRWLQMKLNVWLSIVICQFQTCQIHMKRVTFFTSRKEEKTMKAQPNWFDDHWSDTNWNCKLKGVAENPFFVANRQTFRLGGIV